MHSNETPTSFTKFQMTKHYNVTNLLTIDIVTVKLQSYYIAVKLMSIFSDTGPETSLHS